MLRFILGPARSGKSSALIRQVGEGLLRSDRTALVLVPEQFSFETERAMMETLGAERMARVEVLSFTRLCERIFRECGGYASQRLDSVGRCIAMDLALHDCADQLVFYQKQIGYPAFQREITLTVGNCKSSLITPELLLAASERQPQSSPLRGKLHDLGVVLAAFNARVGRSCVDPQDDLARAAERLRGADFFVGSDLYIDAFRDFTAAQEAVLAFALAECGEVTAALCSDGLHGEPLGLFSPTYRTAERLAALARRNGCRVAAPERLEPGAGFGNAALRRLEAELFRTHAPSADSPEGCPAAGGNEVERTLDTAFDPALLSPDTQVSIFNAPDLHAECVEVAARIRRAVRTEGFRYRDFAVLTKNVGAYRDTLTDVFRRYGIPLFCDERLDILASPPAALVLSLLRAASRLDTAAFLNIAKSGLVRADEGVLCELDDYCYTYDISGARWLSPFTGNPDGLEGEPNEEQAERLTRIEAMRIWLTAPIGELRAELEKPDGYSLTCALYHALERFNARENLAEAVEALPEEDERRRLLPEAWNTLTDTFDRMCQLLADVPVTVDRYTSLLTMLLSEADYGLIPQTLDAVSLGAVDRARTSTPRAVFLLGVEDGVFPAPVGDAGLFSQTERPKLEEAGLPLMEDAVTQLCTERFLAYTAITAATERICLSYCTGDLQGGSRAPSELIREVRSIFPGLSEASALPADSGELAETPESAFAVYCAGHRSRTIAHDALEPLLLADPEFGRLTGELDSISSVPEYCLQSGGAALFEDRRRFSPSQVSAYYQCRFSYFCRYGMEVKAPPKATLSVLETGKLVHYVLEHLVTDCPEGSFRDYTDDRLEKLAFRLVEAYVREQLGSLNPDERTRFQIERLKTMCALLVQRLAEEFRQSEFTPIASEVLIGRDTPPLRLRTPDGIPVEVIGRVDRVDVMEKNGQRYLRVVDYKSGGQEFRLSDVLEGLNLQMLLYMVTLWKHGRGAFGNSLPAGVLYMPAQTAIQDGDPTKLVMDGLLLKDPEVLQGMEKNLEGVFIPIKRYKNGNFTSENPLATLEQFGLLERLIERRVTGMADGLAAGRIGALPLSAGGFDRCANCDYRSVCKHEDNDPVYQPAAIPAGRIWEVIGDEVGSGQE